mmetsp:Transcript_24674/g.69240  ORF Transcript_24674/g.69240 Transcript_24674/m.69240 type:complete len:532 (-) Transcript_24674:1897-3492(-)
MWKSMTALATIMAVDSISYMMVTPSLIFYVLQCGGNLEQYGFILSTFSLASFFAKPVLGWWIDANGNKFRTPYFSTIIVATAGSCMYFLASAYKDTPGIAMPLIFAGRFLGGAGAANQALGYAYIAAVIPHDKQTNTNSMLSMVRIVGMSAGPGFNFFLSRASGQIKFGDAALDIDPLNSVGLLLIFFNLMALAAFYILLEEPTEKEKKKVSISGSVSITGESGPGIWRTFKAALEFDIILPIFTLLVFNSAFQLIETGFAPAAKDALGWGPVETSAVLGFTSLLLMGCMIIVMYLSSKKVKDNTIISIGCICWIIGGMLMYLCWQRGSKPWHFIVPIIICVSGFPFIAPSNRAIFTKAVDSIPLLESKQGTMQAILSMFASVAGFVTPGLVATFVLRHPHEVEASSDQRELTPLALYVPILSAAVLVGLFFSDRHSNARRLEKEESLGETDEGTRLMAGRHHEGRSYSAVVVQQAFNNRMEMNRRASVEVSGMGIPLLTIASEQERQDKLHEQLQEIDWSAFDDEDDEEN